jgi:hypothetical protein
LKSGGVRGGIATETLEGADRLVDQLEEVVVGLDALPKYVAAMAASR